jgi:GNAT superfamily N-acetyltransferase
MDTMTNQIRNMEDTDLPSVQPLLRQLGYELALDELENRFRFLINSPDHGAFVCETEGKLLGLLHIYGRPALEKSAEAIVQAIVIDVAHRNAGIGSVLMETAEQWALERGYHSIVLYTRSDRDDAHAFYSKLGYHTETRAHFLRKNLG